MMDWMIFLGCASGGCLIGWPVHAYVLVRKNESLTRAADYYEGLCGVWEGLYRGAKAECEDAPSALSEPSGSEPGTRT